MSLVFNIFPDDISYNFISYTPHEISIIPQFSSPKLLPELWELLEYPSSTTTLSSLDNYYSTPSQTPGSNVTTIPAPITPAPKSASSTRLLSGAVIALIVLFVLGGTGVIFTMWQIAAPSKRE